MEPMAYTQVGADPTKPWAFQAVTPNRGYQRFTHGLGLGDVNGDGRNDILEKDGWWSSQPIQLKCHGLFIQLHFLARRRADDAVDLDGDGKMKWSRVLQLTGSV